MEPGGRGLLLLSLGLFFNLIVIGACKSAEGAGDFAGSGACRKCHEEQYASLSKTSHGKTAVSGSPMNQQGCESCHGPGALHAEQKVNGGAGEIRDFGKKQPAEERAAVCLSCHENSKILAFWDSGIHKKNEVACSDCHSIHKKNIYAREYAGCTGCHKDKKAEIAKRSHHPITEGKINCSNCHNPHGSTGPSMIKADSVNELCYSCHPEKRGPFVWEHPPVEENCANCHTPHGSTNSKLMTEKVPNLCQSCHDVQRHPGARYSSETAFTGQSPSNRFFGRSCMNCHNAIHGSNAPANPDPASGYNSGKFFVR